MTLTFRVDICVCVSISETVDFQLETLVFTSPVVRETQVTLASIL